MTTSDKTALEQTIARFLTVHADVRRFWVALSGGLDSCVLLHLLARQRPDVPVQVLHVNHQLSPRAGEWQVYCQQLAAEYGFAFTAEAVALDRKRLGLERAARDARYVAFEAHLESGDMLLMAHHQDDQAETLMLRLMRGTGLRGLGAMASVRPLGEGRAGRPLLAHSREQLRRYAQAEGLQWVEDESNQSAEFDRNYLRLEVMPLLTRRWPAFGERWARTAALLRESEDLLNEYAAEDLQAAALRPERHGQSIDIARLAKFSGPRRNAVLRYWLQSTGHQPPEQAHLHQVQHLLDAEDDAQPLLALGSGELRRFNQRLYLTESLPPVESVEVRWDPAQPLSLLDGSKLSATPATSGLRTDREYRVTLRQGGERCQPHDRAHSQKLKKLLQEHRLEPWLRDRIPLIYTGDQLAAVGDLWVCREFYADGEPAWKVQWEPAP